MRDIRWMVAVALLAAFGTTNVAIACTVLAIGNGEMTLFGNNEDYALAEPHLWTVAATDVYYGYVALGFDRYAQGGINTAGLCFDATGVPGPSAKSLGGKHSNSNQYDFCQAALRECATINELEEFLRMRYLDRISGGQFLFADASGASLVLCVDARGEVVIDRTEGSFRVITNFNVASPELGGYPCWRFSNATAGLTSIVSGEVELTVEALVATLDIVHFSSGSSETMYSNIFDLTQGIAYVYFQHDFDNPLELDVAAWTATSQNILLSSLFGG
ncbi:hypothetical protein KKG90_11575 [Candidatus Bipolaricaulota bacterium]|nr:hypothetical protein [Candidatus Bipolaricaulota bacterium]